MDLPIICTLTESELKERRGNVLDSLRSAAVQMREISDGYAFCFEPGPDIVAKLARVMELESQCCQFLTFKLTVAAQQSIVLEVSGPPGAKALISDFFGADQGARSQNS